MTTHSVRIIAAANEGGGAALDQVIGMSVAATIVSVGLLWIGYLHRQRRITWLQNLADKVGNKFNRPPWVALQICLFVTTIVAALFGFIWDVSLHIGKGRDAGPLLIRPLLHPVRAVLTVHRRHAGDGPALRQARIGGGAHHPHLVCTRRRTADGHVRPICIDRVSTG